MLLPDGCVAVFVDTIVVLLFEVHMSQILEILWALRKDDIIDAYVSGIDFVALPALKVRRRGGFAHMFVLR